ncbi:MAG: hypothetical protein V9E81_16390 [Marmoricola sp.]
MSTRSQAVRSQVRLRAAMLAIMVLISLFAARLLQLQAVDPKSLALMAQESGVKTIDLPSQTRANPRPSWAALGRLSRGQATHCGSADHRAVLRRDRHGVGQGTWS